MRLVLFLRIPLKIFVKVESSSGMGTKAYPKSGTRDLRRLRPGTQKVRHETRDPGPISKVRDPGPLRWNPRPENRNPYLTWDPRPDPQDTERETCFTYDR